MTSRLQSRIQTRRRSRIDAILSSVSMTFTRASEAALDGVVVGANVARYPSNSGIVGVLVEESHTNLALYSNEIDNAYWTKNAATVSANAGTAPDGTLTADKLVESAGPGVHYFRRAVLTDSSPNTVLLYAKAAGRNWLAIEVGAGYAYFDIANGVIGGKEANTTASIKSVGNGWYQCVATYTIAAAGNINLTVDLANGDFGNSYTGDGTSGVLFWGVNATTKAYPLSEVMTTSATATMAADTLTVPTQGLLTPQAGSVTTEVYISRLTGTPSRYLFRVPDSGATDELYVGIVNNKWQAKAGSAAAVASAATATTGAHYAVLVWSGSTWDVYVDGALVLSGTGNTPFAAFGATGYIGSDGTAKHINDGIRRQYYHAYRMSPAQAVAASLGSVPSDFTAHLRFSEGKLEVIQGHAWGASELTQFLDGAHAN